ncbi:MAG: sulfatase-like hydrolase/transferase [DPANN group archaeon]|nr:sulfatase-like hydrolase/transferase [DPANN group archaeon]
MNIIFFIFLSLFLFFLSVYLFKKTNTSIINRAIFSVLVFSSIIFYLFYVISDYFTGNGITDAVVYHLKYGLEGAGFLEYWELIVASIIVIAFGFIFSYWIFSKKSKNKSKKTVYVYTAFLLIILSLLSSPATIGLHSVLYQGPIATDFDTFYKQPYMRQVGDSKNLVVIYGEGLERTYFNETIFPDLIKGLRELESKSTYFTNIKQIAKTGYTIAGMVASQCGIPLFSPSHGNSLSGMDEFLPLADCLGDLLHKEGYYLAYYGGADLDFQGKRKFYDTHKFDEIKGRNDLLPEVSYWNWWGLYDDSLFDLAFNRFIELSENQDKFALFLLTLDTHHPDGSPSRSCNGIVYDDGSNSILNAVACSDYLITNFANKIVQSPYGNKTVIVVASDTLSLRNTATELLKQGKRRNLFMILEPNANNSTKINNLGSTMDIGVTILPFIGYKGAIGLGRDLTNTNYSWSEVYYIQKNVTTWKQDILNFWSFPIIKKKVKININDKTMKIDDRLFRIPILVELDSDLQTTLKFQFYLPEKRSLVEHVKKLNNDTSFFLVDECRNTNKLGGVFKGMEFCLVFGKGNKYNITSLYANRRLTRKEIMLLTDIS